ncbi:HAD-like domain-containing protein [Xylariales sp. AK1849]|nr:HAD-like domain-containing protein [Xylariales sp. AK1849]
MSIFLDFDGTITARDTIGELAKFALRVRAGQGDDLEEEWEGVVKAYMDDYDKHVDEYHMQESARCAPEHEVSFLREMKTVELKSLDRINKCRVFRGITDDEFRQAGQDAVKNATVKIRPGFKRFVEKRVAGGWRIWVISVNWSTAFIDGVLDCADVNVVANHVQDDGCVVGPQILNGPGAEPRNLTNSCDKLDAMRAVIESESLALRPCFYFGDSITDLECLLKADHGVIVSDDEDSKLLETLRRIKKRVPHVADSEAEHELSWASNYDEITENIVFDVQL